MHNSISQLYDRFNFRLFRTKYFVLEEINAVSIRVRNIEKREITSKIVFRSVLKRTKFNVLNLTDYERKDRNNVTVEPPLLELTI